MAFTKSRSISQRALVPGALFGILLATASTALAHPLGNFTINQYDRIEVASGRTTIHHVVDMAEIPTLQELVVVDADGDGNPSAEELDRYAARAGETIAGGLALETGGASVPLRIVGTRASLHPGAGGLKILRIEADLVAELAAAAGSTQVRFANRAYSDRLGWREIAVVPSMGVAVFDSTAFGNSLSDELRAYPEDALMAPLDERSASFSCSVGSAPAGATALKMRDGRELVPTRDLLAELIAVRELTPWAAFLGLCIAAGLGGLHALSPGHGKTVVGAYLVGSRGTAKHAAFLGLTVTITHTAGVFALGLVTLFASEYVLPERLFPILSLLSGAIVLAMGLSLFVTRLRAAIGVPDHHHGHDHHDHDHLHDHDHHHDHGHDHHHHHDHDGLEPHSHGGRVHSHLPPGADGAPITWRSLLALGISGGLLPCPSALVVLLAAIALQRVGYGLLLVVAFSAGLAGVLTGIGLLFLYARRFLSGVGGSSPIVRLLPILSAFVIAAVGATICYSAIMQTGFDLTSLFHMVGESAEEPSFQGLSALGVLGLGLLFGLKHATEADHVIAVSTIVSEHKSVARAALVGGLWGLGHTASLVVVGVFVLALRIAIPESVASWLEFGVALMIIGLGATALMRGLRNRSDVHIHRHEHDDVKHVHVHMHEDGVDHDAAATSHPHAVRRFGIKPFVVGAVHGLAGSAALTLLVLTQINSVALGLLYLAVFGIGSIGGMLIMSGLVGLPFAYSSARLGRFHHILQIAAGAFSVAFGLWYAYDSGAATGLLVGMVR